MARITMRQVRIFVSSPGDCAQERALLDEAVERINKSEVDRSGILLRTFAWENDVVPRIGPPPGKVIDEQTPLCDIYVGIMSARCEVSPMMFFCWRKAALSRSTSPRAASYCLAMSCTRLVSPVDSASFAAARNWAPNCATARCAIARSARSLLVSAPMLMLRLSGIGQFLQRALDVLRLGTGGSGRIREAPGAVELLAVEPQEHPGENLSRRHFPDVCRPVVPDDQLLNRKGEVRSSRAPFTTSSADGTSGSSVAGVGRARGNVSKIIWLASSIRMELGRVAALRS